MIRLAYNYKPPLDARMVGVRKYNKKRIAENCLGFIKRNFVLIEILFRLFRIPLKSHTERLTWLS